MNSVMQMIANNNSENARRISESRSPFVPSIMINNKMESIMANVAHDLAERVVYELSELYAFNADEALELLNLGSMVVTREEKSKKVVKEKVVKEKVVKEKAVKAKKEKHIPLPFSGVCDDSKCFGLSQNYGLYTQCPSEKSEGDYCSQCATCLSESGVPMSGTIQDRMQEGFTAPDGKSPVHFTAVMRKLRLTREEVEAEALKQGVEVSEENFIIPEKAKKEKKEKKVKSEGAKKGRPQKAKKVLELETNDIFSAMVEAASLEDEDMSSLSSNSVSSNESGSKKKSAALSEEKLLAKQQKAAEKEAKEHAKKQKEEEKAAKELAKKQKEEEKAAKELAKKQKEEEKAAKELAKQEKSSKTSKKATKKVVEEVKAPEPEAEEVVKLAEPVKCVIINGKGQTKKTGLQESDKKFLKTSQGDILDFNSRAVIGTWNKEESRIVFNEDYVESEEEEEEEEEDYDE